MYKINLDEFVSYCFQSFEDAFSFMVENTAKTEPTLIYFK